VIRLFDENNNEMVFVNGYNGIQKYYSIKTKSVFIPAKEMLSHSQGLLALERERDISIAAYSYIGLAGKMKQIFLLSTSC